MCPPRWMGHGWGLRSPLGDTRAPRGTGCTVMCILRVWLTPSLRPLREQVGAGCEDRATRPPPHIIRSHPFSPDVQYCPHDQRCTRPLGAIGLAMQRHCLTVLVCRRRVHFRGRRTRCSTAPAGGVHVHWEACDLPCRVSPWSGAVADRHKVCGQGRMTTASVGAGQWSKHRSYACGVGGLIPAGGNF